MIPSKLAKRGYTEYSKLVHNFKKVEISYFNSSSVYFIFTFEGESEGSYFIRNSLSKGQ